MRNLNLWIFLLLALAWSCRQEVAPTPPLEWVEVSPVLGEFDLFKPDETVISLQVNANRVPEGGIEYVRLSKRYNQGQLSTHALSQSLPTEFTFSLNEMLAGFDNLSLADLNKGDQFQLVLDLKARDESVLRRIYESAEISVTCISDLSGTYFVSTSGQAGPGGGGTYQDIRTQVSVTLVGEDLYEVSDISGGMFPAIWGGDPQVGRFKDNCHVLNIQKFIDQWDDEFKGSGEVNGDTLVLRWQTAYGDVGTSTYVLQ